MLFYCRAFERPGSERTIEHDDPVTAPDAYAHEMVDFDPGDVLFVEVSEAPDGPWTLWRCEGMALALPGCACGILTGRVSVDDARSELARAAKGEPS